MNKPAAYNSLFRKIECYIYATIVTAPAYKSKLMRWRSRGRNTSEMVFTYWSQHVIDVLNKDCRRSISAILTWVPENVKISARPLNSIGNLRVFTLLLKYYLLPLAHTLLRVKCLYMSLVCINVTQHFFSRVVFFPAVFSAGQQTCLVA